MRYERASAGQRSWPIWFTKPRRRLFLIAVVVILAVSTFFVSKGSDHFAAVTGSRSDVKATEQVFLAASVLIDNLGSPVPPPQLTAHWLLTSHPIARGGNDVVASHYPWIDGNGHFVPLSPSKAAALQRAQANVIRRLFAGRRPEGALPQTLDELAQVIHEESGRNPTLSGPGGASIVSWLRVTIVHDVATLEAHVNVWESTPTLKKHGSQDDLVTQVNTSQVDALASMKRIGSHWMITKLSQGPWQQAT